MTADADLKNVCPNMNIGKTSRFAEEKEIVGLCRYCGVKTDNFQKVNGAKQPLCSLLCGGLLLEIEEKL